jgi:hypothetical protein
LWKIRQEFGIAGDDVEYEPYWGQRHLARTTATDIVISSYRKPSACLIAVANLGLTPQTFAVTLEPHLFGGKPVRLTNAETGETIALADQKLTLSLPARDYALVLAEAR